MRQKSPQKSVLKQPAKLPFFYELAQHTQQITNSAGKTLPVFIHTNKKRPQCSQPLWSGKCIAATITDFPGNENKISNPPTPTTKGFMNTRTDSFVKSHQLPLNGLKKNFAMQNVARIFHQPMKQHRRSECLQAQQTFIPPP